MQKTKNIQGLPNAEIEAEIFFQAKEGAKRKNQVISFFLLLFFFGLVLPCEPRKILPFFVFLSPFPMEITPPSPHITNNAQSVALLSISHNG
jgi:hypothetical protein